MRIKVETVEDKREYQEGEVVKDSFPQENLKPLDKVKSVKIDAKGVYYQDLNRKIRELIYNEEIEEIELLNVNGQRYIGAGINKKVKVIINGIPGNDLGIFMDGPTLIVNSNAQDGVGNTMNDGKIVIHGMAGDVLGYGMRNGKIFIKGDVGYRVGIHMKSYKETVPALVAGGKAGDFFGEYMAGGILVLLGLNEEDKRPFVGNYVGTGMHGGTIYLRGEVEERQLGKEVGIKEMTDSDFEFLNNILKEYSEDLGLDIKDIMTKKFIKLIPVSHRPYGRLYAY